jgi:hypothetical protein
VTRRTLAVILGAVLAWMAVVIAANTQEAHAAAPRPARTAHAVTTARPANWSWARRDTVQALPTYHAVGTVINDANHDWVYDDGEHTWAGVNVQVVQERPDGSGVVIVAGGYSATHGAFTVPFPYSLGHLYYVILIPPDGLQFPESCGPITGTTLPCGYVTAW